MFSVRIRRSLSYLLVTSMLSSSLSPAFATFINNDDDNPEPQNTQTITAEASTDPLFTLKVDHPFWDAMYSVLSPAQRDTLGQVSKHTHEAKKRFDKTYMLRTSTLMFRNRGNHLAKRFGGLVLDEVADTYFPLPIEGYGVRQEWLSDPDFGLNRDYYYLGGGDGTFYPLPGEGFDISRLNYLDLRIDSFDTLKDLLTNSHKNTTLHVSLNDSIDDDDLTKIRDLFPFQYTVPKYCGTAVKKQNSPLLNKLNSLRVATNGAATAISFIEWWSAHLRVGDKGNTAARPHLQIFINQITRNFKFSGEVPENIQRDVEVGRIADPRKVAAEISKSKQERLEDLQKDFDKFSVFLSPFHAQDNARDILGNTLKKQSLLKVLSRADLFEGVVFASVPDGALLSGGHIHGSSNLPFIMQYVEGASDFKKRKEIFLDLSLVQPTTLVENIALISSKFERFCDRIEASTLLRRMIHFPRFNRVPAVQAVMKNATLNETEIDLVLECLGHFSHVDYDAIVALLSGLLPKTASPAENAGAAANVPGVQAESDLEKFLKLLRNCNAVIRKLPGTQRFGALKYTVAFLTEEAKKKNLPMYVETHSKVRIFLRAFGSMPSDAARDEFCEFLRVNLPLKNKDARAFIAISGALPANQRAELIPLVYPLITRCLEELKISPESVPDVARMISDQQPETRSVFCENLEKLLRMKDRHYQYADTPFESELKTFKSSDLGDLLKKTVEAFADESCMFRGYDMTLGFMSELSAYNQQDRDAVFDLVLDYAPPTGLDRYRVLGALKGVPLTEVREMLNLLKDLSNESSNFDTTKAKAIALLKKIPAQHRSDVVTKAQEDNPSEWEFLNRLEKAKTVYKNVQR